MMAFSDDEDGLYKETSNEDFFYDANGEDENL